MNFKERIAFLPKEDQEYVLSDTDIILDIIEWDLDKEEIESLIFSAQKLEINSHKKREISIA